MFWFLDMDSENMVTWQGVEFCDPTLDFVIGGFFWCVVNLNVIAK